MVLSSYQHLLPTIMFTAEPCIVEKESVHIQQARASVRESANEDVAILLIAFIVPQAIGSFGSRCIVENETPYWDLFTT